MGGEHSRGRVVENKHSHDIRLRLNLSVNAEEKNEGAEEEPEVAEEVDAIQRRSRMRRRSRGMRFNVGRMLALNDPLPQCEGETPCFPWRTSLRRQGC